MKLFLFYASFFLILLSHSNCTSINENAKNVASDADVEESITPPTSESDKNSEEKGEAIALVKGNMVYKVSDSMELNLSSFVTLDIGKKEVKDIIRAREMAVLVDTSTSDIRVQAISISETMSAQLFDPSNTDKKFNIVSKDSSKTQQVDLSGQGTTNWTWEVTPIQPGIHPLNLTVIAIIETPSGRTFPINIPVFNKLIYIKAIENENASFYHDETMDTSILYGGFILAFLLILGGLGWWLNNRRKMN